jgi:uncharacterized protein with von Willebrand factor type A (vWA) domain
MSPYEVSHAGGSVEHFNDEAGAVWMKRLTEHYRRSVWINPQPERNWGHVSSLSMVRHLMENRMFGLTLSGLDEMAKELSR